MKSTKTMLAMSAVPLALAIAGCSHGGGGTPGISVVAGDVIAKTATDTASNVLNDGETLKADSTTTDAVALSYGDTFTASKAKATDFALKKNGDGGVDMTVNGKTVSFAAGDANSYGDGWEKFGHEVYNYTSDSAAAAIDGSDDSYFQVWGYYTENGVDGATQGVAVVGAETDPSVVKAHANATYAGHARAETRLASDANERTVVKGDLTLKADFQAGSVDGKIDNLVGRYRGAETGYAWTSYEAVPGASIEMTRAQISANGFAGGKLVATDPSGTVGSLAGSTYSGRFYGPDADQVAGVLSIQGTGADGKFVGTGYFAGDKQ